MFLYDKYKTRPLPGSQLKLTGGHRREIHLNQYLISRVITYIDTYLLHTRGH